MDERNLPRPETPPSRRRRAEDEERIQPDLPPEGATDSSGDEPKEPLERKSPRPVTTAIGPSSLEVKAARRVAQGDARGARRERKNQSDSDKD